MGPILIQEVASTHVQYAQWRVCVCVCVCVYAATVAGDWVPVLRCLHPWAVTGRVVVASGTCLVDCRLLVTGQLIVVGHRPREFPTVRRLTLGVCLSV